MSITDQSDQRPCSCITRTHARTHGYVVVVYAIDDFVKGNISRHASVGMREYASIWARYTSVCAGIICRQMLANIYVDKREREQCDKRDETAVGAL